MDKKKGTAVAVPIRQKDGITRLLRLQDKVEVILERSLKARRNDNYLAYRVYHDYYGQVDMKACLIWQEELKLPSVESIGRCRRKIQQSRIDLRADKEKESYRIGSQIDFIEYSEV